MTEASDFERKLLNSMTFTPDEHAAYLKLKAEGKFDVKTITIDELKEIIRSQVKAELPGDREYSPRVKDFKDEHEVLDAFYMAQEIHAERERQRTLERSAAIIESKRVGCFHTADFPIMPLSELKEKAGKMPLLRAKEEAEWINDLVTRLQHFPERLRKEVEASVIGWPAPDRPGLIEDRWAREQDTVEFIQKSVPLWQQVADVYAQRVSSLQQQGTPAHIMELIKIGTEAAKRAHKIMKAMRKANHDTKPKNVRKLTDLLATFYHIDAEYERARLELNTICLQPVPQLPPLPSLTEFMMTLSREVRILLDRGVHVEVT